MTDTYTPAPLVCTGQGDYARTYDCRGRVTETLMEDETPTREAYMGLRELLACLGLLAGIVIVCVLIVCLAPVVLVEGM